MCGICGEFYFPGSGKVFPEKIQRMTRLLSHRGPDQEGFFISADQRLGLGHRRLKVIDLKTGDQPMANEDGSIIIIFNGEIYNFLELRAELSGKGHLFRTESDTEVILHLYEEEGVEGFRKLVGMFAFALWEEKAQRLILARDPVGIKPLFYFLDSERLVFASELKPLILGIGKLPPLSPEAIFNYLILQYVPGPETIFSGVKKIEPGTYLLVDSQGVRKGRFIELWQEGLEEKTLNQSQAIEELKALLEQSVRSQLIADVPLGAFLSGGIDSSTLVALMKKIKGEGTKTFSVDFSALGGAEEVNETFWSKFSAGYFKTDHHQLRVSAGEVLNCFDQVISRLDEPIADPACFPTYLISKLARTEVTVVLTGEGADELFGGYLRYRLERWAVLLRFFTPSRLMTVMEKIAGIFPHTLRARKALRALQEKAPSRRHILWSAVFPPEQIQKSLITPEPFFEKLSERFSVFFPPNSDPLNSLLYADFLSWLADDLLVKVDRMSMAHSLEARVPYLDHRLVQKVFSFPGKWKIGFFSGKKILKKAVSGLIPEEIIARKKAGFTLPLGKWFRNELKNLLRERLNESEIRRGGIFEPKAVAGLLEEHFSQREDLSLQIYSILLLQSWKDKIKNWTE